MKRMLLGVLSSSAMLFAGSAVNRPVADIIDANNQPPKDPPPPKAGPQGETFKQRERRLNGMAKGRR